MSPAAGDVSLRHLTEADSEAFASFSCKGYRQPWTEELERAIRDGLGDALRLGALSAIGLWRDATLAGIAAWEISSTPTTICHCHLVAVGNGYQRQGLGRMLKEAVLGEATKAGACAVTSFVHWDNQAMIELNHRLGANVEAIPGDVDYCLCTIPLWPVVEP